MSLLAVYTTVDSLDAARTMARTLVERRLAACAQISAIESFYSWDGAVQNDQEYRVMLKSTAAAYPALEAAILECHPYDLPAIHAVPVEHAHEPYAIWVEEGCSGA